MKENWSEYGVNRGSLNSKESDFVLAAEWLRRGNLSNSLATLDSIITRNQLIDAEADDIVYCKDIATLLEDRNLYNLHPDTIDLLKAYSDVGGIAEYWAQGILFANGFNYEPKYYTDAGALPYAVLPNAGEPLLEGFNLAPKQDLESISKYKDIGSILSVFPNPGRDLISFKFLNTSYKKDFSLEIFDMNGVRLDFIQNIIPGSTQSMQ